MPNLATLLTLAGLAWGIGAPLGTWAWMKVDGKIAAHSASKAARADEINKCNQRVSNIKVELDNAAAEQIKAANEAIASLPNVPNDADSIKRLCDRSASCRDR